MQGEATKQVNERNYLRNTPCATVPLKPNELNRPCCRPETPVMRLGVSTTASHKRPLSSTTIENTATCYPGPTSDTRCVFNLSWHRLACSFDVRHPVPYLTFSIARSSGQLMRAMVSREETPDPQLLRTPRDDPCLP